MKMSYITHAKIPSKETHSIQIMKMCEAFSNCSLDINLYTPRTNHSNIDVYRYYNIDNCFQIYRTFPDYDRITHNPLMKLQYYLASALKAKIHGSDIVYSRDPIPCYFSSLLEIDVMVEFHKPLKEANGGDWMEMFFKRILNSENLIQIITISEALKNHYLANYAIDQGQISVAHDAAEPINRDTQPISVQNPEKLHVGYIGSLYKGKGIELIAEIIPECPWADFHIVGGEDERVEHWSIELKDVDNVYFHGFVPQSDIDQYKISFDVLLAPYQREVPTGGANISEWMSPLKIFEYMSTGSPILASDLPVLREVLKEEENAILLDPDNSDDWCETLDRLSKEPHFRQSLGSQALNDFYSHYTWEQRARSIVDIL